MLNSIDSCSFYKMYFSSLKNKYDFGHEIKLPWEVGFPTVCLTHQSYKRGKHTD